MKEVIESVTDPPTYAEIWRAKSLLEEVVGALSGCNTDKVASIVYKIDEVYTYSASAGVDTHLFYCWNVEKC